MGLFEVRKPSHFPSTLLKSVTAAGCHWRVSQGAMELQATMRCKKAKPINPTIFFIYILLWQSHNRWSQADGFARYPPRSESAWQRYCRADGAVSPLRPCRSVGSPYPGPSWPNRYVSESPTWPQNSRMNPLYGADKSNEPL